MAESDAVGYDVGKGKWDDTVPEECDDPMDRTGVAGVERVPTHFFGKIEVGDEFGQSVCEDLNGRLSFFFHSDEKVFRIFDQPDRDVFGLFSADGRESRLRDA